MSKKSLQFVFLCTVLMLSAALLLSACVRSAKGVVPTPVAQGEQTRVVLTPGETVIAADATTPTSQAEPTFTPIPTMTPTPTTGDELPTLTPTTQPVEATPTPAQPTPTPPPPGTGFEYIVQAGDTLWGLAIRFGTTVEAIKSKNGLTSDVIYQDQKLIIPVAGGTTETVTHVVQPGENLFRIALKYNTTVEAIAAANNIVNPNFVRAGQKLTVIQGSGTTPVSGVRYHVVQPGETLWGIALKYNTTAWAIANYNGISNINFIQAGRTLRIP